jgi:hypothetical protein
MFTDRSLLGTKQTQKHLCLDNRTWWDPYCKTLHKYKNCQNFLFARTFLFSATFFVFSKSKVHLFWPTNSELSSTPKFQIIENLTTLNWTNECNSVGVRINLSAIKPQNPQKRLVVVVVVGGGRCQHHDTCIPTLYTSTRPYKTRLSTTLEKPLFIQLRGM